ncbi:hypothetical protein SE17_33785 [Kouleothrix aurantiaca]|uniref:Uncharacterized protein n=1 Tax=Kouleothrix aurantiaca TaxID=186479 RepID=A0A0P9F9T6_9CHLR|nr:hypothetical protein SE17_33785 [Kouleothrix aurantiaca]
MRMLRAIVTARSSISFRTMSILPQVFAMPQSAFGLKSTDGRQPPTGEQFTAKTQRARTSDLRLTICDLRLRQVAAAIFQHPE